MQSNTASIPGATGGVSSSSPATGSREPGRRRWTGAFLFLILGVAAALRIWYASGELQIYRFEDEQYSLQNVRKIYHTGDLEPVSGYYPSPVFNLPQVWLLRTSQALYRATDNPRYEAVGENGRLRPTGVLLTRLYQTLCGILTVFLVFLIGRKMGSLPGREGPNDGDAHRGRAAGLIAASVFAFLPWSLHASGYNKPDALLVMGVTLAFWASLRALESRHWGDYLVVGLAISLAMGAKLTGGLAAIPITLGTAFLWRDRRRLALLCLAGATSALSFIAANPYWRAYLHFIQGLQKDYSGRTDASHLQIPLRALGFHLDGLLFGTLLGSLALVALGWLLYQLIFQAPPDPAAEADGATFRWPVPRIQLAMFLAFPIVYTAAYAAQTPYFKPNNFLPVVPFSAVALGCFLAYFLERSRAALHRIAVGAESTDSQTPAGPKVDTAQPGSSRPAWARRWLGPLGAGASTVLPLAFLVLILLPLLARGTTYVYNSRVPTTYDLASNWLALNLKPKVGRLVYVDGWSPPKIPWEGRRRFQRGRSALSEVDDLITLPLDQLRLADGLLLRRHLPGRNDPWAASLGSEGIWFETVEVEPALFRRRGPALTATYANWRRLAAYSAPSRPCGEGCLELEWQGPPSTPALGPEVPASLLIQIPISLLADTAGPPRLAGLPAETGEPGETPNLFLASKDSRAALYVSRRFRPDELSSPLRLRGIAGTETELEAVHAEAHRWRLRRRP